MKWKIKYICTILNLLIIIINPIGFQQVICKKKKKEKNSKNTNYTFKDDFIKFYRFEKNKKMKFQSDISIWPQTWSCI